MKITREEYQRGIKGKHYGIYNTRSKRFMFDICEDTPMLARARLFQIIGDGANRWRFEPKELTKEDIDECFEIPTQI